MVYSAINKDKGEAIHKQCKNIIFVHMLGAQMVATSLKINAQSFKIRHTLKEIRPEATICNCHRITFSITAIGR